MKTYCILGLALACSILSANAQFITLEPDNYTNTAVLNTAVPGMTLTTAGADNLPIPPVSFDVTANDDTFGFAPTGQKVFGHVNVPFWNTNRRLRMDFSNPIGFLSIDFAGGNGLATETGQLDLFDSANHLLASYVTQPRLGGQVETMVLSRQLADVAWAVAYVPPNLGSFGRLDHLVFSPVPEPSSLIVGLLGAGALAFHLLRHRKH